MVLSTCFEMSTRLMLEILFYVIYHPFWLIFLAILFMMGSKTLKIIPITGSAVVLFGLIIPQIFAKSFLLVMPIGWLFKIIFGIAYISAGALIAEQQTIMLFNIAFILGALIFVMVLNARTSLVLKLIAAIPVTVIFLAVIMGFLGLATPFAMFGLAKITSWIGWILTAGLFPFLYFILRNQGLATFFLFILTLLFLLYVFLAGDTLSLCNVGNNILESFTASKFSDSSFLWGLFS